ncbi:MAG TPA: hypothetical protein V6D33_08740 [Cyanophyceae cyanobacterium]
MYLKKREMLFVKKLPWLTLLILFFTNSIFGWLLSSSDFSAEPFSWLIWLLGAVYIVLIALALAAPLTLIQNFFGSWLQSDTRAFFSVIIAAFLSVIILCWIQIFIRILVLLSAGALARLDLQTARYGEWQSFGLLAFFSLTGFGLGVVAHLLV